MSAVVPPRTIMPLEILRTAGAEDAIRRLDARLEEAAANTPADWREWKGEFGKWSTDEVNVGYSGPTLASCTVNVNKRPGRWETSYRVVLPMHDTVSDDGPSIMNHARSVIGTIVAGLDALEPIDAALDRPTLKAPHRCLGRDPMPWLTAAALVSEESIPERRGETLQVSLTTPWQGMQCSDVAGAMIDVDAACGSTFDAACPRGLEIGIADIQGYASFTIRPIDGIIGETMPDLDDPVALLRALRIAGEAGAFVPKGRDEGPERMGDGS
jgi:hypothetical protein